MVCQLITIHQLSTASNHHWSWFSQVAAISMMWRLTIRTSLRVQVPMWLRFQQPSLLLCMKWNLQHRMYPWTISRMLSVSLYLCLINGRARLAWLSRMPVGRKFTFTSFVPTAGLAGAKLASILKTFQDSAIQWPLWVTTSKLRAEKALKRLWSWIIYLWTTW